MTAYLLLKIVKSMQYETIDILIAQFMPGSSSQVIRVCEEQSQWCSPLSSQILEEYNEQHKPMNLVLFDDALEHLTRVHRVIRMDQWARKKK